ncbi:hypothetical protein BDY24DRAFT_339982, partial [Mrakia frigida]|uniref:uncharacterized protein n=1 Tax=Mrakia frigida TaxID=29902 RepID=UPI003FCC1E82
GGAGGGAAIKRIVILSVHGWFPNAIVRYIAGEPTGTSSAFGKKMEEAVRRYLSHGEGEEGGLGGWEKLTVMPLEGEGKVEDRVDRLFKEYLSRPEWVEDLRCADAVLVATHSQGGLFLVLVSRLNERKEEGLRRTDFSSPPLFFLVSSGGVHVGPLAYLNSSSVVMPYLQYFENAAAHELFEFQDTESAVSRAYTASLSSALDHGVKFVYVASLNDQVVPVYGAIFSPVSHPSILRVLHIDGAAYSASDFVTNLLIFCLQLRNAGLSDGGMVAHLSEVVASGLTGVGHSTAYKEDLSYDLAVRYLFETTPSKAAPGTLEVEEFLATEAKNSYEIPWILRGIMEDPLVLELFGRELDVLRSGFEEWQPTTVKMKDLRRKVSLGVSLRLPLFVLHFFCSFPLIWFPFQSHSLTPLASFFARRFLPARTPPTSSIPSSHVRSPPSLGHQGSEHAEQERGRYVEP